MLNRNSIVLIGSLFVTALCGCVSLSRPTVYTTRIQEVESGKKTEIFGPEEVPVAVAAGVSGKTVMLELYPLSASGTGKPLHTVTTYVPEGSNAISQPYYNLPNGSYVVQLKVQGILVQSASFTAQRY